jgi:hypothetical protein
MSPADVIQLMPSDLDDLDKIAERPSSIKRIRDHHHYIARLIAQGRRTTEVAREVGYSISRVSILKGDPAFRQLVEMYRVNYDKIDQIEYADVKKKAALLLANSIDHRNDQYEEDPDSITPEMARADGEFAQAVMDDKITKVATLHGHLDSTNIAEQFELQSKRADRLIAPAHLPGSSESEPEPTPVPTPGPPEKHPPGE